MIKTSKTAIEGPPPHLATLLDAVRALYGAMDRFDSHAARALSVDRTAVRAINLMERGAVSPGHIAQELSLTSGSVTALLQRLEHAGHIVRIETEDGRRRDAQLTGAGRRAANREFERLGRSIAEHFSKQTPSQIARIAAAIGILASAFDAAAESPTVTSDHRA